MARRRAGLRPYFVQPFYVGFELVLQPLEPRGRYARRQRRRRLLGAENADEADRAVEIWATGNGAAQEVGGGRRVTSMPDPDGNAFGITERLYPYPGPP